MKKKNKVNYNAFDPNSILSGKALKKAIRARVQMEFRPQIAAYKQDLKASKRARRRDDRALARLGRKTQKKSNESAIRTTQLLKHGLEAAGEDGRSLVENSANNLNMAQERMDNLASTTLGKQLASQQAAGVGPGLADQALSEAVIADRNRQSGMAGVFANAAQAQATGMVDTARNRVHAQRIGRQEQLDAIRNAILSRRMESRAQYGDDMRRTRAELKTARSLKGAAKTNALMEFREAERQFANERMALLLDAKKNKQANALGWYKAKNPDGEGGGGGSKGGGGGDSGKGDFEGSAKDLKKMGPNEWKQWLAEANEVRKEGSPTIVAEALPKFVGQELDLDMSGRERKQFTKRYESWLRKKGLLR